MTENFDPLNDWGRPPKTKIYLLWLFLYCIHLLVIIFGHPPEISWLKLFSLNLVNGLLFLFIAVNLSAYIHIYLEPETREWHACEHKSVSLIKAELEPNSLNLKLSPALYKNRGSVLVGLHLEIYLLFILVSAAYYLKKLWLLEFTVNSFLIWSVSIYFITAIWLARLRIPPGLITDNMILPLILMPLIIIPLILEKYLALKEPSEDKLQKTAAELRQFIKENSLYPLQLQ